MHNLNSSLDMSTSLEETFGSGAIIRDICLLFKSGQENTIEHDIMVLFRWNKE